MMTDWYQKSMNSPALSSKGEQTQAAYTRALLSHQPLGYGALFEIYYLAGMTC